MAGLSPHSADVAELSPEEFERLVLEQFERSQDVSKLELTHREIHKAADGTYEIDLTLRFTGFGGAEFLVVVECKHHRNPIKRDLLMILNQKKQSLKAHKAILCASVGFQSGAIEFAEKHGIATVRVVEEGSCGRRRRVFLSPPPWFPRLHLHLYREESSAVSTRLLESDGSDLFPHVLGIRAENAGRGNDA